MSSLERDINGYLFYEFGFGTEADESRVSESWPFHLQRVTPAGEEPVFEFVDDEPFFAVVESGLNFLPKAGMEVNDLRFQAVGGQWIEAREPVSLEASRPTDPRVPSGIERRQALQSLGNSVVPGRPAEILEGLFLRSEQRYLGLFRAATDPEAIVGGLPCPVSVPFPKADPWRRLAWGVGWWLEHGGRVNDENRLPAWAGLFLTQQQAFAPPLSFTHPIESILFPFELRKKAPGNGVCCLLLLRIGLHKQMTFSFDSPSFAVAAIE
jgi:hypothetical protein